MLVSGAAGMATSEKNTVSEAYQKRLYDSVGRQWFARMNAYRHELTPGTVDVFLVLSRDGTIRDVRVLANTSDQRVATLVIDAIKHSQIPRPPAAMLNENVFKTDMKFTVDDLPSATLLDPSRIDDKIKIMPGQKLTVQFKTVGRVLKAPRRVEQPNEKQPSITLEFGKDDTKPMLLIQNRFPKPLHLRCLMRVKGQTAYSESRFSPIEAGASKRDVWADSVAELVLFDFRLSK
jgi:hypothetical protein